MANLLLDRRKPLRASPRKAEPPFLSMSPLVRIPPGVVKKKISTENENVEILKDSIMQIKNKLIPLVLAFASSFAVAQMSYQQIGNMRVYEDGTSSQMIGNMRSYSNGVTEQRIGNQTVWSNGLTAQDIGNQRVYSNGVTAQQIGNQTVYSNGISCQWIGNQRVCN